MKKLLIALIGALVLVTSCTPEARKNVETVEVSDGAHVYVRKFVYNGHQYIEFSRAGFDLYDNYTGFVHDPDCPCQHENEEE